MSNQTPQSNTSEKREDFKLKLAGTGYIVGDSLMLGAAMMRQPESQRLKTLNTKALGAVSWMSGGIAAAVFGNPTVERQVKIQAGKLEDYLNKQGIVIPEDARRRHELLQERSVWDKITNFCFEHPSELLNTGYAIGAALLLRQGFKEIGCGAKNLLPDKLDTSSIKSVTSGITAVNQSINKMSTNFWIGAMVLPGALIGLFSKEDPKAREKAKDGNAIDKAVAFVTEKPLRISAAFYMLNNIFLAMDVGQDWTRRATDYATHNPKPHLLSGSQLAVFLACNVLLLMSSRNQITDKGFDEKELQKFTDAAVSIIEAQPLKQRENVIKGISEFMSEQRGFKRSAVQIEEKLREALKPENKLSPVERRYEARLAAREAQERAANS